MGVKIGVLGLAHGHVYSYLGIWRDRPELGVTTVAGWDHDSERLATQAAAYGFAAADGVADDVFNRADFTISFGRPTWPHRLVRVMLLEQIYRAKQIIAGHPYHRD